MRTGVGSRMQAHFCGYPKAAPPGKPLVPPCDIAAQQGTSMRLLDRGATPSPAWRQATCEGAMRSHLILTLRRLNDPPLRERWLLRDHAPETISFIGPILER